MVSIREQLEIVNRHQKEAPVKVVPIAKELGLRVFRSKAGAWPDNLSGMLKRTSSNPEIFAIYVNGDHHENRRRFTIAHEISHFILHRRLIGDGIADDALYRSGLRDTFETEANRLAADILMPWHLINSFLKKDVTDIRELAKEFEVSNSAMSIRLGVPYETL